MHLTIVLLFSACFISCENSKIFQAESSGNKSKWVGTWATAPQLVEPANMPPAPDLTNNTIRQVVRVSIGGKTLRLRFSNVFSKQHVTMKRVCIGLADHLGNVDISTQKTLRFNGKDTATISPFGELFSDAVAFRLPPGARLAITIYFGNTSPSVTGHPGSRTTSYILKGDQTGSPGVTGAIKTDHWYVISGVDVLADLKTFAVAALGNSITDGRGSGTNKQNRWTDILSERLLNNASTQSVGVLNLGIGGNCVLRGGLGPTALERFERDILSQHNVRWVILLEGINDIGNIKTAAAAPGVARELIDAYSWMIDKAHAKGIKVYGCTILPFKSSFYDAPFRQEARAVVNQWIRTGGRFDAVIDFDSIMRNPYDAGKIAADLHDGDMLHPNEEGYKKMGSAIDLNLFTQ